MKNKPYPLYDVPDISDFREYLGQCKNDYADNTAFSFDRNNVLIKKSYIDVNNEAKYLATKLISMNFSGIKIAVLGENSYEWILSYFATVTSKNVIVPIDKQLPVEQVEFILRETDARLLFYSDAYQDYADVIKRKIDTILLVSLDSGVNEMLLSGRSTYDNDFEIYQNVSLQPNDLAAIIYTSGTTGTAKGVMLTHKNICSNYWGGRKNLTVWGKSVLVLPLHHTYAFTGAVLCVMGCGTEIYINRNLKRIVSDMLEQKPNEMTLVPLMLETFYNKIWQTAEEGHKANLLKALICVSNAFLACGIDIRRKLFKNVLNGFGGNLEIIICGGAALDEHYVRDFRSFGIQIIQGYGITECSPMLAVTRNYHFKDKSVGLKLTNIDIKINIYPKSNEGEILVKGDSVTIGYYNMPELTAESFDDEGYFKTGDVGYTDDDGFVYVTGRVKNMIVRSNGKNVYPEELEFELSKIPAVKEVLVYEENNKIVAEVYPNGDRLSEQNITDIDLYFDRCIKEYNKSHPLYKNIDKIKLRNTEFPKTTSMKIKRIQ